MLPYDENDPRLSEWSGVALGHLEDARRTITDIPEGYTHEEWAGMVAAAKCLDWDGPSKPLKFPQNWPDNHLVYFVGGETGPIKIGWTQNLRNRLPCIQNGSSVQLSVLATQCAPKTKERLYHKQFAASRVLNEWFERTPELMALIESLNRE